jgi:hypothetical protein
MSPLTSTTEVGRERGRQSWPSYKQNHRRNPKQRPQGELKRKKNQPMGRLRTRKWSDEDTLVEKKKKKNFIVQIHISSRRGNLDRLHYRVARQLKSPVGVDLGEIDVYEQASVRYHFWARSPQKCIYVMQSRK